jgi:hypothetical protein
MFSRGFCHRYYDPIDQFIFLSFRQIQIEEFFDSVDV